MRTVALRGHGLGPHWKGHAFLFDRRVNPVYDAAAGRRLLLVFVVLEAIIGPRLSLFGWLHLPMPPVWLRVPVLMSTALLLVRFVAKLPLSAIGLHRWSQWSTTEKSYFIQVVLIANVVFVLVLQDRLRTIVTQPALLAPALTVFLPYFLWGFYQETLYRGILQTELVRRWGAVRGVVVSNVLFTFGPLHFYHFGDPASAAAMFAGIFAIGLFFVVIFLRSGNLWMVAVFHGIGNCYIDGTQVR